MCACKGRRSSLFNAAKLFKVSVWFWLHVTDTKCSEKVIMFLQLAAAKRLPKRF